jgi:hypothetical protein
MILQKVFCPGPMSISFVPLPTETVKLIKIKVKVSMQAEQASVEKAIAVNKEQNRDSSEVV